MRAWFLNLDADDELAEPSARTPSSAVLARTRALADRLVGLVPPGDLIVPDPPASARLAAGRSGRAFCPTPRALAALARADARPPPAPPLDVLRRVNHRRFSADLGRALAGARWIEARADLEATLAGRSPTGLWLLRRPFGFAARGRVRFDPARRDAPIERWIEASLRGDGVEAAPWVERAGDYALHGHLSPTRALVLGEPTVARCDETGAWIESARAGERALDPRERSALVTAAEEAAAALASAGYFGPFGIDAFRYRDEDGALRFEPRCEVNARYSMGWAVGMGERRPDLDD